MNNTYSCSASNSTAYEEIFKTSSRKLEQFLFVHDILANGYTKDEYGMTVWNYSSTPEVQRVVSEYKALVTNRLKNHTMIEREA